MRITAMDGESVMDHRGNTSSGWWLSHPSEKYEEFVS
jgi:hypothetical protein